MNKTKSKEAKINDLGKSIADILKQINNGMGMREMLPNGKETFNRCNHMYNLPIAYFNLKRKQLTSTINYQLSTINYQGLR